MPNLRDQQADEANGKTGQKGPVEPIEPSVEEQTTQCPEDLFL
jgi:hypothetical protein